MLLNHDDGRSVRTPAKQLCASVLTDDVVINFGFRFELSAPGS